jgi:uncharacterized membrane protein YciS (DUF1049 family)
MDFRTSLVLLMIVFASGFASGYAIRALVSAKRRRRLERHLGYPLA